MEPNAVMVSMAQPLPETTTVRRLVDTGAPYLDIQKQAAFDWKCVRNLDTAIQDEKTGTDWLCQNGYKEWLEEAEPEDQVRMLGWLQMIGDMALDLAEEEDEEADD